MFDLHRVKQHKERGRYDRETANQVLDAGWVAHVGFVQDNQPFVLPMLYARDGERLLLHGAVASRLMGQLAHGVPVCVTVTHIDGLVLASSVFDHSANYRSVCVFGEAYAIEQSEEKAEALNRMVVFLVPGREHDARPANPREMNATCLLAVPIERFSVKIRSGPPAESPARRTPGVWTGVIPLQQTTGTPVAEQDPGHLPEYLQCWR